MKAGTLQFLVHKLWATRETKCLSIIDRALSLLQEEEDLPETGLKQRFGESRVDLMAYGRTPWS
jgi:hypothetical protein